MADRLVSELAAERWGVLSLHELLECGLSHDAVSTRVRSGRLHKMHRAVYAVGHANPPLEGRFLAAVKACGAGAVLSHFSAAALWEFVKWYERRLEVTVAAKGIRGIGELRVHRVQGFDFRDITRHKGIPVTSPARTVLDLASVLDYESLRRAVRQAQAQQRTNVVQLAEVIGRSEGRRGIRSLRRIIATGSAPTRSELEDVVLDLILRNGLAHPEVNMPLYVAGRRLVPDFRWPEQRVIVEADGAAWHDNPLARADDAERQALLEASGERVLRVTWEQAIAQPSQTVARIEAAGAPRAVRKPVLRTAS